MANSATLNTLTTSVRTRMNLVNMSTISDAEIKIFLKDSLAALWEIMTSRWRDYYVSKQTYSFVANQESYDLPDDFRAASAVYVIGQGTSPTQRIQLRPFSMNEFANWSPGQFSIQQLPLMYRIMGTKIYFTPVPSTAVTSSAELWYVPQWTVPADDDTTIDSALPNGWELWVIFDTCCAIATRNRFTEAFQMFAAERQKAEQRLIAAAQIRDETPQQVVDVYAQNNRFWFE